MHGTKRDAEAKLRELVTALDKGEYVSSTKETVGGFVSRWLGIAHRYLNPVLGPISLNALRPDHVQALYANMLRRGLSPRTVVHTHRLLRECLSHAVKWRVLSQNVCDAVDPPRPQRKQMAALDTDEVDRFLAAAETNPYRDVFFVLIYTGLRRSEVLALHWSDVDLDRCTLNVVAGLHRLPGQGLVLLPTKTSRSRRQVPITEEVVDVLHQVRGEQTLQRITLGSAWNDSGFVFTKPDGGPLDPERVTKGFAKTAKEAGFNGIRLHDLRHSHASLMLKAGVGPKEISERLGHASISITMDVYAHLLPGMGAEAAKKFSMLLAESRKDK